VGTLQGKAVGFIMWQDTTIIRFAVKPTYRHMGIGAQLLGAVENTLIQRGKLCIAINVPESLCRPGKVIDVSSWLRKHHFQAEKLLLGQAVFCGNQEDLIYFNKILSGTITHG
jgi:GNAT superfamily N-acetyltransferase